MKPIHLKLCVQFDKLHCWSRWDNTAGTGSNGFRGGGSGVVVERKGKKKNTENNLITYMVSCSVFTKQNKLKDKTVQNKPNAIASPWDVSKPCYRCAEIRLGITLRIASCKRQRSHTARHRESQAWRQPNKPRDYPHYQHWDYNASHKACSDVMYVLGH